MIIPGSFSLSSPNMKEGAISYCNLIHNVWLMSLRVLFLSEGKGGGAVDGKWKTERRRGRGNYDWGLIHENKLIVVIKEIRKMNPSTQITFCFLQSRMLTHRMVACHQLLA